MTSFLIWVAALSLIASALFSTISYALRMMSRVILEQALIRFRRANSLDTILSLRHELALSASTLRLLSSSTVIIATALYFHLTLGDPLHPRMYSWKVFGYTLLTTIPALLVASVAIPQSWARYAGEPLIAAAWPTLRAAHWLLYPLVVLMKLLDELIRRLAGVTLTDDPDTEAEQVEQEIMAVVSEGAAEGAVFEDQKKMIEGVISFRDLQVGQIMTPRTDIAALDVNAPLPDVRDKILRDGLSRVPVYENTLDNIVGILYAKDLLATLGDGPTPFSLRTYLRPPLFVPRTKPLRDLLRDMRHQQVHLAIVLDEYGGTSGLVTTEDIIEEIIGDIADEFERPEPEDIKHLDDRTIEVDARTPITELNRALSTAFPEDQDYTTLGGFVIATLGNIPTKGQLLTHDNITITVLDAEPRRVKKLRLDLPPKDAPTSAENPETAPH